MLVKLLAIDLLIQCISSPLVVSHKPVISFGVFEREDTSGQLGYSANLVIPSLHISAESNLTVNKNGSSEEYSIELKNEEPIGFEATGSMKTWRDSQLMARFVAISLTSKTFPHLNTRSVTSMTNTADHRSVFTTNLTLEDSLNKMSAQYNCTLIVGQTCPTITLIHNLTTIPDKSLLHFSSNVTEVCDLENESSQMGINISLSSVVWHLANAELKQIFNFGKSQGSESMNASHPLMDVSVVADWDRNAELMHFKKAIFDSKVKQFIPNLEIEYKKYKELPNQLLISIFKEVPKLLDNLIGETNGDKQKEEL